MTANPVCNTRFWCAKIVFAFILLASVNSRAQEAVNSATPIVIPDEPRIIDPAQLMPEKLNAPVTVNFTESSVAEVAFWLEQTLSIPVLIDKPALLADGVSTSDPITERLDNQPLYFLLNRLNSAGLDWELSDGILTLTSSEAAGRRLSTESYNITDLLDGGYKAGEVIELVMDSTNGDWAEYSEDSVGGSVQILGDILFLRATRKVQLETRALLAGLRTHGRRTDILEPAAHLGLRAKMQAVISVDFDNLPLAAVVRELSRLSGAELRLDVPQLAKAGVRGREPVTLKLANCSLETVLRVLLANLDLTWTLRDGVVLVTTQRAASHPDRMAIFDVRDLSENMDEASALMEAIEDQTGAKWSSQSDDGEGGAINAANHGTLVVRQTEKGLDQVAQLLAAFRSALRNSKRRPQQGEDPAEILTRYYRVDSTMGLPLRDLLPLLVDRESWGNDAAPERVGRIHIVPTGRQHLNENPQSPLVEKSTLIIRQSRKNHEQIGELIQHILEGDIPLHQLGNFNGGLGGGGLGGMGFGGGFFAVPADGNR